MITNADVTIYNKRVDKKTRQTVYVRTILRDVHWYTDQKVSVGEKGLNSADVIKIRVPTDNRQEIFVEPAEYARLEDPTGYWTAANGDLIAKGVIEDEITRDTELKSRGYLAGVILSHSDNRCGSSPHIRIGGG